MAEAALRWNQTNFIGSFDSRWVLSSAVINTDHALVLDAGGSATLVLTDAVNAEFKYSRVAVTFSCTDVSAENNYRNKPTLMIQEVYKNSADAIDTVKIRSLAFNTYTNIAPDKYTDETIYATLDRKMAFMKVVIKNETTAPLTIHSLSMSQSIDVSETQISTAVNTVISGGSATDIRVYRNADNSVNGLGVLVQGDTAEIKLKPTYFNGVLTAIETNYGQTISIQNIIEMINLTN